MKAIILRERPMGIYYELPIFESNPKYCISWPDITIGGFQKKTNSSKKYECYLILVPNDNDTQYQIRSYWTPDFTDEEMRLINESYFYLLDHPDIKECKINLV
jgi:hypothetical protein